MNIEPEVNVTSDPRAAIVFSNIAHLFTHTFTILYATAVLHLPTVFDLPYGEMLSYASLGLVLYGVAALPAGWLADRWSRVGMLIVFFFGVGGSTLIIGAATQPTALYVGLSLLGLFASIYHPVGIAWLIAHAKAQGMTLGVNAVFGNLGSALAPIFVGAMIDYGNWRLAFFIPAILAFVAGFVMLLAAARGIISDRDSDATPAPAPPPNSTRRVLMVLTLTMACSGLVYAGLMNTIPKLFQTGLADTLAGNYTKLGFVAGAVIGLSSISSVAGGWLADRYSPRTVYLVFVSLVIPPLMLITSTSGVFLLLAVLLALSFNVTFAAAENMLVARYTPFKWRSVAFGARFVLALGIGGLTVRLAGYLYDRNGNFDLLYLIFGTVAAVAVLGVYLLPREPNRLSAAARASESGA